MGSSFWGPLTQGKSSGFPDTTSGSEVVKPKLFDYLLPTKKNRLEVIYFIRISQAVICWRLKKVFTFRSTYSLLPFSLSLGSFWTEI